MPKGWQRSGFGGDDQILQRRDAVSALDVEALAEIVEERDAELLACFEQAEESVPGITARPRIGFHLRSFVR